VLRACLRGIVDLGRRLLHAACLDGELSTLCPVEPGGTRRRRAPGKEGSLLVASGLGLGARGSSCQHCVKRNVACGAKIEPQGRWSRLFCALRCAASVLRKPPFCALLRRAMGFASALLLRTWGPVAFCRELLATDAAASEPTPLSASAAMICFFFFSSPFLFYCLRCWRV